MKQLPVVRQRSSATRWLSSLVLVLFTLALVLRAPSQALIEAMYSLKQILDESKTIVEGEIESVDVGKKTVIATVKLPPIRGACPYKKIQMNVGVGQIWYPEVFLKRLKAGDPVLFFWNEGLQCEAYTVGHFFQIYGQANPDPDATWWNFTHIELKMNRTYKGSTKDLIALIRDVVAGKRAPPPPDPNVLPFTREELLGMVERTETPTLAQADRPDELEAWPYWKVESWGRPASVKAVYSPPPGATRSEVLPGLLAEYYAIGEALTDFPEIVDRKPAVIRADKAVSFDGAPLPDAGLTENFCARWTGFVRVPNEGKYRFYTTSDDGSLFIVGDRLVVNNGGVHDPEERFGEVELTAGEHPVRLDFFKGAGGSPSCKLLWEGPGIAKQVITGTSLFHRTVGPRGQVLQVEFADGSQDREKVAVSRLLDADWSDAARLLYEACNQSAKPVRVAWGVTTMPGEMCFESPQVEVPPGRWSYNLQVNLAAPTFKCQRHAAWRRSAIENRGRVVKLSLFVYNAPTTGALLVDRIRPDGASTFVRSIPLAHAGGKAGSASWADYDGDGGLDVLLSNEAGVRLYRNAGGEFSDVTASVLPPAIAEAKGPAGAAWADYDGDGQVDLLLAAPALLHNDKGKFALKTAGLGLQTQLAPQDAGWFDANGDGRPDILLSGRQGTALLLNTGQEPERFKSAGSTWGLLPGAAPAYGGLSLADFDGDGFADFLCHQGKGLLFHNEEGKSYRQAPKTGIEYDTALPVGAAWGDYDNDGALDLFVPQNGKCCLYHNNNDLTFSDVSVKSGALAQVTGSVRTGAWGDINLDGNLDLAVGFAEGPVRVYLGDGKGRFGATPALTAFECTRGASGLALADWDDDGDLDLLVMGASTAGVVVNETPRLPGGPASLRVRLDPSQAPGALVRLYDAADKPLGVRQVGLTTSFNSQEPPEALFAVPPGQYKVAVLFTNGEARQAAVAVGQDGALLKVTKR